MKKIYKKQLDKMIESLDLDENQKLVIKKNWLDYLSFLDDRAGRDWFFKSSLQFMTLITSILIPVIANIVTEDSTNILDNEFGKIVITILGIIAALSSGIHQLFEFEKRWLHYRKSAETVRIEGEDFFALVGNYRNIESHKAASREFLDEISTIKKNESQVYMEQFKIKGQRN